MGEGKTLESPLNKIRKMSRQEDIPVPSCSYSKKSNVINSNLQNNNLPLKSGNDSENETNVAKTVKAKPTIITMHHWHKLLAGKKESKQTKTDGFKKKEQRCHERAHAKGRLAGTAVRMPPLVRMFRKCSATARRKKMARK